MMNKTLLIFKHEFITTIKRTGFIILAMALPVLALLAIGITQLVSGIVKPSTVTETISVGYVDEAGGFNQFNNEDNVNMISFNTTDAALQAMVKGNIKEYFVIPSNYTTQGIIELYTLEKQVTAPPEIQGAIKDFLSNNLLAGKIPSTTINVIESPLNLVNIRLTTTGATAKEQGGLANLIIPGIFSLLLALSLSFSSAYLLQGLGEEKENRLMEILLSSVSTRQLITGKVLGIGTAGLVQVVVWLVSFPLLLKLAPSSIGDFINSVQIPSGFLVLGVLYFILGYLLFAVLSVCVAAITATAREGQGLAAIFTIFAVAPLWFTSLLIFYPNSPIWVVFSIFPFSAPVLVILRLGVISVPAWQIAASITVLILFIVGGLLLAAKLLKIYILMYGKRPNISEIIKNLRSS